MQWVIEQEDAYWHARFGQTPYYVAGRSYDQYQPAYALGWRAALRYPELGFKDLEYDLELLWHVHRCNSFLPWHEVKEAVKAAWEHACSRLQEMRCAIPGLRHRTVAELADVIGPLHRGCTSLAQELSRMQNDVPMNAFARQVLERHIRLLESLAQGLAVFFTADALSLGSKRLWMHRLHARWRRLSLRFSERSAVDVYALCEQRERDLLSVYAQALCQEGLAPQVQDLLHTQRECVQKSFARLQWVRQNWLLN